MLQLDRYLIKKKWHQMQMTAWDLLTFIELWTATTTLQMQVYLMSPSIDKS
jgi:hypothetical protein